MASGYEKRACGVDPNKGWDTVRPRRWWHRLTGQMVLVASYGLIGFVIAGFVAGWL